MGRPRYSRILIGLAAALAAARPMSAQGRSTLEVGVGAVSFPVDSSTAFGPFAAWTMSKDAARYFVSGAAAGVIAPGGASGSAQVGAGGRGSLPGGWTSETSVALSALSGPEGPTVTTGLGNLRLLRAVGNAGGWLRWSGDVGSREAGWLGGQGIDVGAWWRWQRIQLSTSLGHQWNLAQLFGGPSRRDVIGTVPVTYSEASLGLHVDGDEASLDLTAGVRRDRDAPRLYEPALSLTAAVWQSPNRALVVSVARQLPDFIHGADAMDYVTIGFRFNEPTPRAAREARIRPIVQVTGSDSRRELRVRASGARTVDILGDFTNWEPMRLSPRDGLFTVTVMLSPGSHRIVVRLDGGEWKPAANTPAVDDDLGGRVGLLLVP